MNHGCVFDLLNGGAQGRGPLPSSKGSSWVGQGKEFRVYSRWNKEEIAHVPREYVIILVMFQKDPLNCCLENEWSTVKTQKEKRD